MMLSRLIKGLAILGGAAVVAVALVVFLGECSPGPVVTWLQSAELGKAETWQRMASPGQLSKAHAFIRDNCAACHTAVKGPDATKCIACHAGNEGLLQRQPTAFHGYIRSCRECHSEHQGIERHPTAMDHGMLTKIGLRQLESAISPDSVDQKFRDQLDVWIKRSASPDRPSSISPYEAVLNCSTCHANQDPHLKLFGQDCAQCHSTTKWTIDHFRHPSPRSADCAQCHQAPPSHYMEHFRMVSARVAAKPMAKVNQCYLCHQTTSWNDIKGVGWYKHH